LTGGYLFDTARFSWFNIFARECWMCLFLKKGFEETVSLSADERVSLVEELLTSLMDRGSIPKQTKGEKQ
jgi:hypothetical protein